MSIGRKSTAFRYHPEELETRDHKADEKFADGFVNRNREAINRDLRAARAALRRGQGKSYESAEDLAADALKQERT